MYQSIPESVSCRKESYIRWLITDNGKTVVCVRLRDSKVRLKVSNSVLRVTRISERSVIAMISELACFRGLTVLIINAGITIYC